MEKITFTDQERIMLSNQYEILSIIDKKNENTYIKLRDIVRCGYEGLYYKISELIETPIPDGICKETEEILDMFHAIDIAKKKLTAEESESKNFDRISFVGFDSNPHSGYAEFLVKRERQFLEQECANFASGSSNTIGQYRKLLDYCKSKKNGPMYLLDYSDLLEMLSL